jgi:hypothetical protein
MNTNLIRSRYGRAVITALLIAFGTAQASANQGNPPSGWQGLQFK